MTKCFLHGFTVFITIERSTGGMFDSSSGRMIPEHLENRWSQPFNSSSQNSKKGQIHALHVHWYNNQFSADDALDGRPAFGRAGNQEQCPTSGRQRCAERPQSALRQRPPAGQEDRLQENR